MYKIFLIKVNVIKDEGNILGCWIFNLIIKDLGGFWVV